MFQLRPTGPSGGRFGYTLMFTVGMTLFGATRTAAQPAVDLSEWSNVEAWQGDYNVTYEQKYTLPVGGGHTMTHSTKWVIAGQVRLKLAHLRPSPAWDGSDDVTATFESRMESTTGKVITEKGTASRTSSATLSMDVEHTGYYWLAAGGVTINTTVVASDQPTRPGFQVVGPFPPSLSGSLGAAPPATQEIVGSARQADQANGIVMASDWRLKPTEFGKFKTIRLWINSFIPRDMAGVTADVPGSGPHAGKTMIHGPVGFVNDCFLTDQRGFDPDPAASARVHHEVSVSLLTGKETAPPVKRSSATHEVDCATGSQECVRTADVANLLAQVTPHFDGRGPGSLDLHVRMIGAGGNPCFRGAAPIKHDVEAIIVIEPGRQAGAVSYKGEIRNFPAYEMYYSLNGDAAKAVFPANEYLPPAGTNALGLLQGRKIAGSQSF